MPSRAAPPAGRRSSPASPACDPEPGVTRAAEGIEAGADPNRRDIQISDAPSVLCLAGPLICIKAEPRRRFYGASRCATGDYSDDTDVEPYHPANSTRWA